MEETEAAVDFWGKFQELFVYDDQSRWKAVGWIIATAGTLGAVDLVWVGTSVDDAVFLMGAVILIMSVTWIGWYCYLRQEPLSQPATTVLTRRGLIIQWASYTVAISTGLLAPRVEAHEIERRVREISENPTTPQNIQDAKYILSAARRQNVHIPNTVIQDAGNQFLRASSSDPRAWDAALACVDYRTFLDSLPALGGQNLHPTTNYDFGSLDGEPPISLEHYGDVPIADAAQIHPIGIPDKNKDHKSGDAYLVFRGGGYFLGGMHMQNIVFNNAHIFYDGGPLEARNVRFIDCRVEIVPTKNGRSVAQAILEFSSLTFFAAQ